MLRTDALETTSPAILFCRIPNEGQLCMSVLSTYYAYCSMICFSWCAGTTPDCLHSISPFLKRISVGTPLTWYTPATCGFLSTSIFTMVALSPSAFFTSDNMGAIILQGPHHSAEKSTSTGLSDCIRSANFTVVSILAVVFKCY